MSWRDVAPSDEVEKADWIRAALHPSRLAHDVGTVIPAGFEAYARIFHPASGPFGAEVRWAEVASWNGTIVHPEMQFHSIGGPWNDLPQSVGPSVYQPRLGTLSPRQAAALVALLARHTSTAGSCWLCLWDGYGYFEPNSGFAELTARPIGSPPDREPELVTFPVLPKSRVRLPDRDYLLFKGSISDAVGWEDGPNLWWPQDIAWCVASEIDLPYTYVGASSEAIEKLLHDNALEALPAMLTHGITYDADRINST
jgi:hypothetical protein